jgi:hypothetical protein
VAATPTPRARQSKARAKPTRTPQGEKVCYPAIHLPAVEIPSVDIPATTIPATTINGRRYPARNIPARHIEGRTIRARTIKAHCYAAPPSFAPSNTTVRVSGYDSLDDEFSQKLSEDYWADTGSTAPDPTAAGFGELNAAGYPKNQYVRPYVRRDGTMVSGYWRNSPSDGLPTCRVISC